MSLPHKSVATIDNVQFINLTPLDINPLMSKCEIKVFYLGQNRNGSYIKKEVATQMAKTLRGAPIVGFYKQSKEDFTDHGQKITLDDQGVHFECMTKPYGFVAPDAQVWFKKFTEEDEFGNTVERQYLMTTGYLWTGQYEQVNKVFEDNGKPQSMELDNESLDGHWSKDYNTGMEFFIINDAIISKLCILGNDVEPCFEGSSVTAPEVSNTFTKKIDENFTKTLFTMMKELEFALQGGNRVDGLENNILDTEQIVSTEAATEEEFTEQNQDNSVEEVIENSQENIEDTSASSEFANKDDEEKPQSEEESDEEEEKEEDPAADEDEEEQKKKPESKNSLHSDQEYNELETNFNSLNEKYNELETNFNSLTEKYNELVNFKNEVEDKQKDELIEKFYMLSEEDKKDVFENKRNYSLDQIEEKLAVICFRKKVNFDLEVSSNNENKQTEGVVTTFNYSNESDSTPDWVKQVEEIQKKL